MTFFPTRPSYYSNGWDWTSKAYGVFAPGDTVTIHTRFSGWGATAYTVRDYTGAVVSSGSISGDSFTLTAPGGGWTNGWYRVYATGPTNDAVFGHAYGSGNFVVMDTDNRFIPQPAGQSSYAGTVSDGTFNDYVMKAYFGAGTSRISIADISVLTGDSSLATIAATSAAAVANWTASGYLDPGRTRYVWMSLGGQTWDKVVLSTFGECYIKDATVDGTKVFCSIGSGTSSGAKIQVYYPNNSTLVETYDNLATRSAAGSAINGVSAYIYFNGLTSDTPGSKAATAIGNTYFSNLTQVVQTAYANGVTYFEGPINEPGMNSWTAQIMKLFYGTVKAAQSSAKVLGPSSVDIGPDLSGWDGFLAAGGGAYVDEFSTHDYNAQINGDLNCARQNIAQFRAKLDQYGFSAKPVWQTEANNTFISNFGVLTPRRANFNLAHSLVWEQFGTPREKNSPWYDLSHGFNSYPSWLATSDGSPEPQLPMFRTLAAETWGQTHDHAIDFGTVGNTVFLGSVYTDGSASTYVVLSLSYMPAASLTFSVSGASSLVSVDCFGNESTNVAVFGNVTVEVAETPTYVRVPAGVTVSLVSCNDWDGLTLNSVSNQASAKTSGAGTDLIYPLGDTGFLTDYKTYANAFSGGSDTVSAGMFTSVSSFPTYVTLQFPQTMSLTRAIIHSGPVWQTAATLLDFDVQTSPDNVTWTTQETVNVTADAASFAFCGNGGCVAETYWKRQWIFDVPFAAPVQAKGLRIYVRSCSYGGEPDAAAAAAAPNTASGLSWPTPFMVFQEISAIGSGPSTLVSPPQKIGTYNLNTATTVAKVAMPRQIPPGHHVLLALGFSGTSTPTVTVTDDAGNTWQADKAANYTGSNACHAHIYSSYITSALEIGDSVTVTYNTATSGTQICAYEIEGAKATGWLETGATATSSGTTAPSSGNFTTANTDLMFYASTHQLSSFEPGSGWLGLDELTWSGGRRISTGYQIAAAGTYAASGVFGSSTSNAIAAAAYQPTTPISWQLGLPL